MGQTGGELTVIDRAQGGRCLVGLGSGMRVQGRSECAMVLLGEKVRMLKGQTESQIDSQGVQHQPGVPVTWEKK